VPKKPVAAVLAWLAGSMVLIDKHVVVQDKKVVKLSPDDNMYMEGFALRVFAKADKQDRAGRADL
jgi:hypothetical protein